MVENVEFYQTSYQFVGSFILYMWRRRMALTLVTPRVCLGGGGGEDDKYVNHDDV